MHIVNYFFVFTQWPIHILSLTKEIKMSVVNSYTIYKMFILVQLIYFLLCVIVSFIKE